MRTTFPLPLVCLALVLGAASCGDDDTTAAPGTATADADATASDETSDDSGTDNGGSGDSGEGGGGTLSFQGTTYDLEGGWCGAAPEQGDQWQGWDDASAVDILVRDGGDPPRYSINLVVDDETWQFSVTGGAESDDAVAAAEAIETTETSIRGEGLMVWPAGTERDEREALAETVDFDYSC